MKTKFKKDKYRRARGGYSRVLEIHCEHCGVKLFTYQKDGPGLLKRLYLDRIITTRNLWTTKKLPLKCLKCKTVLGVPYIYPKEKRKAFRLFAGAITKKITKLQ